MVRTRVAGNSAAGVYNASGRVRIDQSTIANNVAACGQGGGVAKLNNGGGLADLQVSDSVISGNSAEFGGGLRNGAINGMGSTLHATATLTRTTLSNNHAFQRITCSLPPDMYGSGGGIWNSQGATVSLLDSLVSGNLADGAGRGWGGGGILNFGRVTLDRTTIAGNSVTSGPGGGVDNQTAVASAVPCTPCVLSATNSTISGNNASSGGGVSSAANTTTSLVASNVWWSAGAGWSPTTQDPTGQTTSIAGGRPQLHGVHRMWSRSFSPWMKNSSYSHWARAHVDPLVALRTVACAKRWPRIGARLRPDTDQRRRSRWRSRHQTSPAAPAEITQPTSATAMQPRTTPAPAPRRGKSVVNDRPTALHP